MKDAGVLDCFVIWKYVIFQHLEKKPEDTHAVSSNFKNTIAEEDMKTEAQTRRELIDSKFMDRFANEC